MLFTITGKHIDITEPIREYAQKKTFKLPKFYSIINQIEVILDGTKRGSVAVEIIARAEHSRVFVVTESGNDAYKSIDLAVHKLQEQLKRRKAKERDDKHAAEARKSSVERKQ